MKNALQTFHWKSTNNTHGDIDAISVVFAKVALLRQGITPISIKKKNYRLQKLFVFKKCIKARDIALFTRQLATMYRAGIPLLQTIMLIERQHTHPFMKQLIHQMKIDIENGHTFADALSKYPQYFNPLFRNLVSIGEIAGTLDTMLDNIAAHQEKITVIKNKIKKALYYPLIVLITAMILTTALLLYVVPQFESLFKSFSTELPLPTQFVIYLSQLLKKIAPYVLILISILIGIFLFIKKRSALFAYKVDKYILKIPLLGTLLKHAIIARYARTVAITYNAGLPLIDALRVTANVVRNLAYQQACLSICNHISAGNSLEHAMRHTTLFPMMVIQMIATGEESGSLGIMLTKIAEFHENHVDNTIDHLSQLLEPILMILLGTLIGGLVIAMYLPIFKLGSVV